MTTVDKSIFWGVLTLVGVWVGWMRVLDRSEALALPPVERSRPAAPAVVTGTKAGNRLRDFTLDDQDGSPQPCSRFIDGKDSLIYFYSGCCGHCSAELRKLSGIVRQLKNESLAFVGVEYFGSPETCSSNRSMFELTGPILADRYGAVCKTFEVGEFTLFVVDRQGVVRYRGGLNDLRAIEKSLGLPPRMLRTPEGTGSSD